jgi:hypothetical protein
LKNQNLRRTKSSTSELMQTSLVKLACISPSLNVDKVLVRLTSLQITNNNATTEDESGDASRGTESLQEALDQFEEVEGEIFEGAVQPKRRAAKRHGTAVLRRRRLLSEASSKDVGLSSLGITNNNATTEDKSGDASRGTESLQEALDQFEEVEGEVFEGAVQPKRSAAKCHGTAVLRRRRSLSETSSKDDEDAGVRNGPQAAGSFVVGEKLAKEIEATSGIKLTKRQRRNLASDRKSKRKLVVIHKPNREE